MKKLTVFLLLLVAAHCSIAQHALIKGTVIDTSEKKNLSNSVVALLRKGDSVLVSFTRADKAGHFNLKELPSGKFIVLITYPTFADYYYDVELQDTSVTDLASVPMITKSQLLQEFVVTQKLGAIRQKKDTTEFIADSFKVAPNANVEALLKRLPGFQVDKDGKITAMGEQIQTVLVDGEEFFGNDPTLATQNIRADNVDKVQVFDKKSDQATFTGIDDGQKTKALNLKLKDDKKNGYFGKISLGGGLKDKFNNQVMFNSFKKKRKLAVYGVMSNTGTTGLSWDDASKFGTSSETMEMDESGMMMFYSEGDGGSYYGEGLPTSWSAGLHYSNKYNDNRQSLNGSYRFQKLNTIGGGYNTSQYILPDTLFYRNERGNNYQQRLRHNVNGTFETQIDSFTSLKVTFKGSLTKTDQESLNYTESLNEEKNPVNTSTRTSGNKSDNQQFSTTALWRHRFAKAGRTISFNFSQSYNNTTSNGFLLADNAYFNPDGSVKSKDTVDQKKINNGKASSLSGKLAYTEPLLKNVFMEVSYSLGLTNSESERKTFDEENGKYDKYVDSLSTYYGFRVITNRGGLSFRYSKKKLNASIGSDVAQSDFKQTDKLHDTSYKYSYVNLFPRANISYNIKPQTRVNLSYNGNTKQPTIDQLQPLRNNTDPLNVYVGNPDLKQEFRHSFSVNFNDYKVLNSRSIWAYASYDMVQDAIGNSEVLDVNTGKRTYQSVNVNGNYSLSGSIGYGFKITKLDLNVNFGVNGGSSRNNSVVNGIKNTTNNVNYGGRIGFNYYKEKKMSFYLSANMRENISKSSVNKLTETKYWSASIYPSFTVYLPAKFEINSDADIDLRQKTAIFTNNNNVVKWNASVGKKFMKDESLLLQFEINDILNQNLGFSRNASSTNITERTYDTIRRFWLLKLSWNFTKKGTAMPASEF
ncbi:MAG: outer membrane beta-barrel family protein [Chitinophagaceae bacterium]